MSRQMQEIVIGNVKGPKGDRGLTGPQGEPFKYEDFTPEQLEALKKNVLNFVNPKVNKSSKIEEVEITKEPFAKTATMKIKRFLYNKK